MQLSRRAALLGLVAVAAPAVIRTPNLLMPIKSLYPARSFVVFESDTVFRKVYWTEEEILGPMLKTMFELPKEARKNGRFITSRDARAYMDLEIIRRHPIDGRVLYASKDDPDRYETRLGGYPVEAVG